MRRLLSSILLISFFISFSIKAEQISPSVELTFNYGIGCGYNQCDSTLRFDSHQEAKDFAENKVITYWESTMLWPRVSDYTTTIPYQTETMTQYRLTANFIASSGNTIPLSRDYTVGRYTVGVYYCPESHPYIIDVHPETSSNAGEPSSCSDNPPTCSCESGLSGISVSSTHNRVAWWRKQSCH